MKKLSIFLLLMALFAPLAMNAQNKMFTKSIVHSSQLEMKSTPATPLTMSVQNEMRRERGIVRSQLEPREIQIVTPLNEPSRLTLTVNSGNQTNAYIPIPRSSVSTADTESQFILSASSLSGLVPDGYYANITGLSFASNNQSASLGTYYVLIQEGSFDGSGFFYGVNDMVVAYYGTLTAARGSMSFTFNQLEDGFDYFGGDLLICFYQTAAGTNSTRLNWYGVTASGMAAYWNGNNGYLANFLPQTTFTYTNREATCVVPADLDLFAIDKTAAGLYWTERGQSTEWEVSYSTTADDPDNGTIITVNDDPYCILTGLTEGTIYYAYVRSICDGDTPTDWAPGIAFRTPATCDQPSDVEISNITQTTADVSWYGNDESYDIRYRQQSEHDIANFINNQAGTNVTTTGTDTDYTFSLSGFSGNGYVAIRHYNCDDMFWLDVTSVTVKDSRGNVVFTGDLTNGIPDGWYTVDYDGDGYNWNAGTGFVYSESYSNDTHTALYPDNWLITPSVPLGGSVVVNAKGQDASYASEVFGVFVSTTEIVEYAWTLEEDVEGESHPITGLAPETTYIVQVRAHSCADAEWSDAVAFTTLSGCDAPTGLSTTNITATSATLNWAEALDEYNVRYKEGFAYGFESAEPWAVDDFAPCSTYDGDGSETGAISNVTFNNQGYTGSFIAFQNGTAATNAYAHSGNAFGACFYASPAPNNDWFILPEITIEEGDVFTFWARSFSTNYLETFKVGVYGGNGTFAQNGYLAGSATESITALTDWTEYSYDLSAYAGQTIQLAIQCDSDDKFAFFIDDIFVGAANWSEPITCTEATYTLEGLAPNTNYVWQVQGVDCDGEGNTSDWSANVPFATPEGYIKHIDPYTSDGGFYLIASPIGQVNPSNVSGMLDNSYDLYYFDQAQELEWINYKPTATTDPGFNLEPGKGYLYANSGNNGQGIDLVFTGTAYTGSGQVTLALESGAEFEGMNLVGNPFADTAYIFGDRPFYRLDQNGAEVMTDASTGAIEPMEGVFVNAESADEPITFTTTAPGKKVSRLVLNLTSCNNVIDRAVVRFGEGNMLPKFQLNENHTKVYMTVEGKDYAVVYSDGMGEMPVNFKAEKNGNYTFNFSSEEVSFGYLHLIDNKTGNDVDLLATPSYSFDAKTTDYESRFKLVFATGNNDDETFAFFSNGSFVINNEGNATLQVIDINGRIMKSESINGCSSIDMNAAQGIYMLRLVNGDNVKVQKVVVR